MKNIAVIFGGKSSEHDISIISACGLMENLDINKYKILPIYITKIGKFLFNENFKKIDYFKKEKTTGCEVFFNYGDNKITIKNIFGKKSKIKLDFCFVACHGINGEDGAISGLLNLCEIPYSCAGIMPSSVAMDKTATKIMCKGLKIPVVKGEVFNKLEFEENETLVLKKIEKNLGYPVVIKPSKLGSSIGVTRCENDTDLLKALNLAFGLDENVLIEKALTSFKEYNIAVLKYNNQILLSKIEQPTTKNNLLSFEDKYLGGSKIKGMESLDRIIPANITTYTQNQIENIAKKVYKNLHFEGVIRIDFLFENDRIYLNEINSIPGSFANYLWDFSYSELLDKILEQNTESFNSRQQLVYTFNSSVLNCSSGKDFLKK